MSYNENRSIYKTRPTDLDLKIWSYIDRNWRHSEIAQELGIDKQVVRYSAVIRKRLTLRKKLEGNLCQKK